MHRVSKSLLLAAVVLAVAGNADAAEAVKLKLMAPIYVDGKGSGIRDPEGVGCRGKSVFVADSGNGRVLRYSMRGDTWTPDMEIVLPELPYPIRVESNAKGEIFVLDGRLRRIGRLTPAGEFQGYLDAGPGLQGAVVPRSFRIDKDDNLIVIDVFSARVLVLDASGTIRRAIPFPRDYGFISDVAVDAAGTILLVDSVQRKVFAAAKDSKEVSPLSQPLAEEANFPTAIATDSRGTIFLVDQNGGGIVVLGQDGTFRGRRLSRGWKEGLLRYPSQMCIGEDGNIFIADRGNNRVEAFQITE